MSEQEQAVTKAEGKGTGTGRKTGGKVKKPVRIADLSRNQDLVLSTMVSKGRFNFEKLEAQIFLAIVAAAQYDVKHIMYERFSNGLNHFNIPKPNTDVIVSFSLNDYPIDMKGHESRLKTAAESLMKKIVSFPKEDGWVVRPLVAEVEYKRTNRVLQITIHPTIWERILDIRKYIEIEMYSALNLTPNGLRFYMLIAEQMSPKGPVSKEYTLDELRERFEMHDVYREKRTFYRKTIREAKNELDRLASLTFDDKPVKRPGSKEIVGVILTPKQNMPLRDDVLQGKKIAGKLDVMWSLNAEERDWLMSHFGLDDEGIKKNMNTFYLAKKIYGDGLLDRMESIWEALCRALRPENEHIGYLIKSLKNNISLVTSPGNEDNEHQGSLF